MNSSNFQTVDITPEFVENLVKNEIPESLTLEYKEDLPLNNDSDKKEFVADMAAFANKSGGIIIYGIEEIRDSEKRCTGKPSKIVGLADENLGNLKQKIEHIIDSKIRPKIARAITELKIEGKRLLVIRIRHSFSRPHAILHSHDYRFHIRRETGKTNMEYDEIRDAFLLGGRWKGEIKEFRINRIEYISQLHVDRVPPSPKLFLHVCPIGLDETRIDIRRDHNYCLAISRKHCEPIIDGGFNIDGYVAHSHGFGKYFQFFRSGAIECYSLLPTEPKIYPNGNRYSFLQGEHVEWFCEKALTLYIDFANHSGIMPPIVLMLTIIDLDAKHFIQFRGCSLFEDELNKHMIGNSSIVLPDILIDDLSRKPHQMLASTFDILWQASGWENSPSNG